MRRRGGHLEAMEPTEHRGHAHRLKPGEPGDIPATKPVPESRTMRARRTDRARLPAGRSDRFAASRPNRAGVLLARQLAPSPQGRRARCPRRKNGWAATISRSTSQLGWWRSARCAVRKKVEGSLSGILDAASTMRSRSSSISTMRGHRESGTRPPATAAELACSLSRRLRSPCTSESMFPAAGPRTVRSRG